MLLTFSEMWGREHPTENLVKAYTKAFLKYTDKEVQEAGYRAMEELKYFPKPSELIKFLKKSSHDKWERDHWRCPVCKNDVVCIIEGKCPYCNSGMPLNIQRPKYIPANIPNRAFNVSYGVKCQMCGKVGVCTLDDEVWKCRQCYSGLTDTEIESRFKKLYEILDSKTFETRKTKADTTEREKRRASLGFAVPEDFPVMTKKEELERKQELMDQYHKIKTDGIEVIEDLPF